MKKLILLLAVVSVGLTGCFKQDDSYKKWEPVEKGIEIYNFVSSQNNISSMPAKIGVMFAMLQAEAAKQQVENLNEVKVNKINIKNSFFGSSCTITAEVDGVYKLTFTESGTLESSTQCVGTIRINTQGKLLKDADFSSAWTVSTDEKFQIKSYSYVYNQLVVTTIDIKAGQTSIYNNGNGTYTIQLVGIRAASDSSPNAVSDWSGSYTLKPASEGFAYSDCTGKEFGVATAYLSGPSVYPTESGTSTTSMSYQITNAKYLNFATISGTEDCEFTGNYNMVYFFPADVTREWGMREDKSRWYTIYYNGFEVTENL